MLTVIKALEETERIWLEVADGKDQCYVEGAELYANNCPCCQYVTEQQPEIEGDAMSEFDCEKYCPMISLWPKRCEVYDNPYSRYMRTKNPADAIEIALFAQKRAKELRFKMADLVGNFYKRNGTINQLVQVSSMKYCLIDVRNGNRWTNPSSDIEKVIEHFEEVKVEIKVIKKTRVKKASELVKWFEDNGWEVSEPCWGKQGVDTVFKHEMFRYCGEEKPSVYRWLPEWLEEV